MADKKRTPIENRQMILGSEFKSSMDALTDSITQSLQKYKREVNDVRSSRVQELFDLIEERSRIEEAIVETTSILSKAYNDSRQLMTAVLADKLKDCEEGFKDVTNIANMQDWEEKTHGDQV